MAIALTSCKKDAAAPSTAPTVATVLPSPAVPGQTITITGTNFTSAATVTVGGVAATSITVTGTTTITATVPLTLSAGTQSLVVTVGSQSSTGFSITVNALYKTPDGDSLSTQIAPSFMRAYFPFDGTSQEFYSGQAGGNLAVGGSPTYVAGVKGQAVSFAGGGLIYPPIPMLDKQDSMQHYTISLWVNTSGNTGDNRETSLFQVNGDYFNDIWGYAAVELKTGAGYGGDTLAIGSEITQVDGRGAVTDDTLAVLYPRATPSQFVAGSNVWTNITVTYNDVTDSSKIYANGVLKLAVKSPILNPPGFGGETFTLNDFGAPHNQITFGTFEFQDEFNASNTYTTGSPLAFPPFASTKAFWHHGFTGSIDEVRVYGNDLSASEVNDLYLLGLHGQ
jgi:hypothetical protein